MGAENGIMSIIRLVMKKDVDIVVFFKAKKLSTCIRYKVIKSYKLKVKLLYTLPPIL